VFGALVCIAAIFICCCTCFSWEKPKRREKRDIAERIYFGMPR